MKIIYNPERYWFKALPGKGDQETVRRIRSTPSWEGLFTRNPEAVMPFFEYCTDEGKEALKKYMLSTAKNGSYPWEKFCAPSIRSYQKAGIEYILSSKATLLADQMGLGKTAQVISALSVWAMMRKEVISGVIVCPAHLKNVWIDEILSFGTVGFIIILYNGKKRNEVKYFSTRSSAGVMAHIVNYDVLARRLPELEKSSPYDFLVFDESHYLKNMKAKRTKAAYKLVSLKKPSGKLVFLTGTPFTKSPIDIFPVLQMMGHPLGRSWYYYATRYCDARREKVMGRNVWKLSTSIEHADELRTILRQTCMVRRHKTDVLTELPGKIRQVIAIDPHEAFNLVKQEREILQAEKIPVEEFQRKNISLPLPVARKLAGIRQKIAIHKIPFIYEQVLSILEDNREKVVIFAHHRVVIEKLVEVLKGEFSVEVITGDTSIEERQRIISKFQNQDDPRILIASFTCAGTGITLTRAAYAVFAELDWIPTTIEQAEDRIHRIGQKETTFIYYVVVENSLEHYIAKKMLDRQREISLVLEK
jgi:SWI/SNF-related matrix-associated actin-dependent regulator 1 of chromatin subfamily A